MTDAAPADVLQREVSRRGILVGGGLVGAAVAALDPADDARAAGRTGPLRRHYARHVGAVFTLTRAGHTHRVHLRHIRDLRPTTAAHRPYCFNLIFAPAGPLVLPDGIYTVRRRGVPTHALFLSAVGAGHAMQAVVNRRTERG